jgi:hypothetical protein
MEVRNYVRRVGIAAACNVALSVATPATAAGQSALSHGDVSTALRFPPRMEYKNSDAIWQQYDEMTDVTRLQLGLASGSPIGLLANHPIVHLVFETTFHGSRPGVVPDSILVTSRVFRLQMAADKAQKPQTGERVATGSPGPMLNLLISEPSAATSGQPWRASLTSTFSGSREVLRADETGIHFQGKRWLAMIANLVDHGRKPGELAVTLYARGDTGLLSMSTLPERVRDLLNGGLSLVIVEEEHHLALPIGTFLQVATAPAEVKTRFGTTDFTIEGDDLDALRDFASRLAPDGADVSDGASHTTPDLRRTGTRESGATGGAIPAGTVIDLDNTYLTCARTLKPHGNHLATVAKAVEGGDGVLVPAGATAMLVVRDIQVHAESVTSTRIVMDVKALVFDGKSYPLNADVIDMPLDFSDAAHDACIPKGGRIQIKLRGPLTLVGDAAVAPPKDSTAMATAASKHESQGMDLFIQRKYGQSLSESEQALRLDPQLDGAHDYAGKALLQLRQAERAEAEFRTAIGLRPGVAEYHFDLARALCAQRQRVPEAITAAREAVRLAPADSTSHGQQYRDYLKKALQSVGSC